MSELLALKAQFEKEFPIPAHWITWSPTKQRYDCHIGLADSHCSKYNAMFNVWCSQQEKIKQLSFDNAELQKTIDSTLNICDENRKCIGKFLAEIEVKELLTELENTLTRPIKKPRH